MKALAKVSKTSEWSIEKGDKKKKVEAAHRQNNREGTERIPVKIRKAGQAWAGDSTIRYGGYQEAG